MTSFYTRSNNNNYYHFNFNTKVLSLISPITFRINTLMNEGKDEANILAILSAEYNLNSNDAKFYLSQYSLFEEATTQYSIAENYNVELTPQMIETTLSNLEQITFEVTDACNLKCKYCGYGDFYENYDTRTHKNLPIEYARRLIEFLSKYWETKENISEGEVIYVSFYGGEPLLNMPFIKSIVRLFDSYNLKRPIKYTMTTNAILLKKHISYLASHDFHLLISLDGNKYNNSYRVWPNGKSSYNIVYECMKYIQDNLPAYFKDNIEFNAVLHDKNSVEKIINFFKKEFSKTPLIGELNLNGIKKGKKDEFKTLFRDTAQSINESSQKGKLEKIMQDKDPFLNLLTVFIQRNSIMSYSDYNSLFSLKRKIQSLPTGTCIPFSKKIFITVNGKLLPCERIGQEYSLGHVTDQKVELDLNAICKYYNKWLMPISQKCSTCYMRHSCQHCIFNFPKSDKPFCIDYLNKENFKRFLKRTIDYLERNPQSFHHIMKDIIMR